MKSFCWNAERGVRVDTAHDPKTLDPDHVIINLTASGICKIERGQIDPSFVIKRRTKQ